MTFKMMATVAAVVMAAGANCGCSAVPPALQASNAYNSVGSAGRVPSARAAYTATSPTVEVAGERVIGADPDPNVRFDLTRNANFHLHGGSGN